MLNTQGFTEIRKIEKKKRRRPAGYYPSIGATKKERGEAPNPRANLPASIEWQSPAYEYGPKSADWYWALGIITLAAVAAAFYAGNYLFGIFTLLAGFSLALYGARRPETVDFKMDDRGIKIGKQVYDYRSLRCFWINYNPPYKKEILLESSKTFMPIIIIPLGNIDPVKAKEFLIQFVKEEEIQEPFFLVIANLLGI